MSAQDFTPDNVKQWLEHAPKEPGPMAGDLRGFEIGAHFYCTVCCGRLSGRGILLPRESVPVWKNWPAPQAAQPDKMVIAFSANMTCKACGKTV